MLRRAEESVSPKRDLSTPACRANRKAEETLQQYSSAQHAKGKGGHSDSDAVALNRSSQNAFSNSMYGTAKELEQSFKEKSSMVDGLIQTLSSNLRLDGPNSFKSKAEQQAAKLREEQRRQKIAEEKHARLRMAQARDPHRKVNLRVDNTRKFGMEAIDALPIPMSEVQFNGNSGMETVNMVDCLKIRQQCKRIDTECTPSVQSLIEDQMRTDRLRGLDPKTGKPKSVSAGNLHTQSKNAPVAVADNASQGKTRHRLAKRASALAATGKQTL
jgi:hypothetical protein